MPIVRMDGFKLEGGGGGNGLKGDLEKFKVKKKIISKNN